LFINSLLASSGVAAAGSGNRAFSGDPDSGRIW